MHFVTRPCRLALFALAATPLLGGPAAGAEALLESGELRLNAAQGEVRIEGARGTLTAVRSFEFNFTAARSMTAERISAAEAVLHLDYPPSANYDNESHDWPADITITPVAGGFRFHAHPAWARNTSVRLVDSGEHYFGLLEHLYPDNRRSPDLRGQVVRIDAVGDQSRYHENWASVWSAFFMTSRGYASFFDTFEAGEYRLGLHGETVLSHRTGELDWYLLAGSDGDRLLASYYGIIGAPKTPPLWALGPIGWRDRNVGGAPNLMDDVRHVSALRIPFTAWWADRPYSSGAEGWSNMDFGREWKDPATWIGELRNRYDLRLMTWIGPLAFEAAFPGRFDVPPGYFDLSDPAAIAEWERRLDERQYAFGVQGHKMDRADELFPTTAPWHDGTDADARQNKYLFLYSKVVDQILRKRWGDDEFNFARAAYQRAQPYLDAVWGGDVRSSWDGLGADLAAGLRCGFMGFPIWGSDTGGYLGGRIDEELYARWLDLGAWSGLFEIKLDDDDGRGPDRPPWVYGPALQTAFRNACEQRMRLLPYLFSLAQTSARTGVLMKPLAYVWPDDARTYTIADEYLLGPSVLVAPIVEPGGRREVYLPAGTWHDLHDVRRRFAGPTTVSVTEPEDRDPVFLRENSILLTGDVPIGNRRIWAPGAKPSLKLIAVPGEAGEATQFEFVDLFDGNRHKAIRLARSSHEVTLVAPALGAPVEIRLLCPAASVVNGAGAVAFGTDGLYTTVRLPAGREIRLTIALAEHASPQS